MAQTPITPNRTTEGSPRTSDNQLFCCKSIDKLISDSEEPERKLKKTLGPVSLTALGIGAVIGSGIFTVIGTAIGGQKFDTSSILNAPLLDFLVTHHASLGRPGASMPWGRETTLFGTANRSSQTIAGRGDSDVG